MENIIELSNLMKQYDKHIAVNNLNLAVPKGEVFGLLGPNGAGKSTTIRMMLSLIKPNSGSINIFGKSLFEHRNEILQNIGSIIEKPDFYLYLSARKNLELFARMSKVNPTSKLLDEMFELVGLVGRDKDKVKTYSHGMKQRLGIAQALIHNPDIVILDEPTTGLDPQGIIDLRNLILLLKNERNKTVVLSSHILSEVELIADSMAIVNKGEVAVQGKVNELLSNEDLLVFIEPVEMQQLQVAVQNSKWAALINSSDNHQISLRLSKEEIPTLSKYLNDKEVKLFSLNYRKKLEDYFLKLTHS
jgi:ABC-type multidrug transport system ATPase subunit